MTPPTTEGNTVQQARIAVVVAAVAAAAAACGGGSNGGSPNADGAASGPVQHPKQLVGDVGKNDAFVISLTDENGKLITHLAAGTYPLTVHDFSSIHDFHLSGAGVNDSTTIGDKTTKQWSVTFKPGSYTFVCDPHASQMHGTFTVS